ncbi:TPA: hypothetical protein EYP13_04050 [Candidatus Micrarchaeota archaeon]|nr:hypothetical protein [Candidatus Micrarchaeota archaeon]
MLRGKKPGDILVTGGNPSLEGLEEISSIAPTYISRSGKIYLATDGDECGEALAHEIGRRLAQNGFAPTKDFVRLMPFHEQKDWFSALFVECKNTRTHEPEVSVSVAQGV